MLVQAHQVQKMLQVMQQAEVQVLVLQVLVEMLIHLQVTILEHQVLLAAVMRQQQEADVRIQHPETQHQKMLLEVQVTDLEIWKIPITTTINNWIIVKKSPSFEGDFFMRIFIFDE